VSRRLAGKAVVSNWRTIDLAAWLRKHRPDVIHLHTRVSTNLPNEETITELARNTSLIIVGDRPILAGNVSVPIHDLNGVGADDQRREDAVVDCVLRQLAIRKGKPAPPAKADADAYRKAEAKNDALVPAAFKKLPIGEFHIPESAAAWKKQRHDV